MRLFIDDERMPPHEGAWVIVRTYDEAIDFIISYAKEITFISFDHDLGNPDGAIIPLTGYDIAKFFCTHVMNEEINLDNFNYYVHSQNPVGRKNIESYMNNFLNFWRKQ